MDNNNLQTSPPPQIPITPPTQPVTPQNLGPAPSGGSNKMILILVLGLILVIALVGGIYMYLSQQNTTSVDQSSSTTSTTSQAPTKAPEENLESELNNIDVDKGTNSDFTSVDSDLQQL